MNEAFGFWLSGLTDGEGCFFIELQKPDKHCKYVKYRGSFLITLRADDSNVLTEIKNTLGFGHTYYKPRPNKTGKANPQFCYKVSSIDDCVKLINIFDTYQLHSKKINDYKVWKEFILYKKQNFRNMNRDSKYIDALETFYIKIKDARRFPKR